MLCREPLWKHQIQLRKRASELAINTLAQFLIWRLWTGATAKLIYIQIICGCLFLLNQRENSKAPISHLPERLRPRWSVGIAAPL
jgi:hypothetical protein